MVPQSHYFAPDDWPPALRTRYGSPVQGASRPSGSEILVYKIVAMKPMNSPANSIVRTSESPTHRRTRTRIVLSGSRPPLCRAGFRNAKSFLTMQHFQIQMWCAWHHSLALFMHAFILTEKVRRLCWDVLPLMSFNDVLRVTIMGRGGYTGLATSPAVAKT